MQNANVDSLKRELMSIQEQQEILASLNTRTPEQDAELVRCKRETAIAQAKVRAMTIERPMESIDHALYEAVASNLITIEEYGSGNKRGILAVSSHPAIGEASNQILPSTKLAHHQLFLLLHLFRKHGVQSPLAVEGMEEGRFYKDMSVQVPLHGQWVQLYHPHTQEYLAQNPQIFRNLFDWCHDNMGSTSFFHMTSYDNLEGDDGNRTFGLAQQINGIVPMHQYLYNKYVAPNGTLYPMQQAGQTLLVQGRPMTAQQVIEECTTYQQLSHQFNTLAQKIDAISESETAERLLQNSQHAIPVVWKGLGHTDRVKDFAVAKRMQIQVVYPNADKQLLEQCRGRKVQMLAAVDLLEPIKQHAMQMIGKK